MFWSSWQSLWSKVSVFNTFKANKTGYLHSTTHLLKNINMLSVNQLNAQVNVLEMWKATHYDNYPLKVVSKQINPEQVITRATTSNILKENGFSQISMKTFKHDAIRVWNRTPVTIKECRSMHAVKTRIR